MIALAGTGAGTFAVDLETGAIGPAAPFIPDPPPSLNLPRVVCAAASGSTVAVVVDARPPILVSYDAGSTWRESGRGLPAGKSIAVAPGDPDTIVYAARNRLYVSRDGGRFWNALTVELPEIETLALTEP